MPPHSFSTRSVPCLLTPYSRLRRDSVLCHRSPLTRLLVSICAFSHVFWESSSNLSSLPELSYLFCHVLISKKLFTCHLNTQFMFQVLTSWMHYFLFHEVLISIFCCLVFEILFFPHNLGFFQFVFYFGICFLCYIFSPVCSQKQWVLECRQTVCTMGTGSAGWPVDHFIG